MHDPRLKELRGLRFPLANLQARGMSKSRQLSDRLAPGSAANALTSANCPQMQNAAVPHDLIVKHNGHRRLPFTELHRNPPMPPQPSTLPPLHQTLLTK